MVARGETNHLLVTIPLGGTMGAYLVLLGYVFIRLARRVTNREEEEMDFFEGKYNAKVLDRMRRWLRWTELLYEFILFTSFALFTHTNLLDFLPGPIESALQTLAVAARVHGDDFVYAFYGAMGLLLLCFITLWKWGVNAFFVHLGGQSTDILLMPLMQLFFGMMACSFTGDVRSFVYLVRNEEIECFTGIHIGYVAGAIVGYLVVLPLGLFYALKKNKYDRSHPYLPIFSVCFVLLKVLASYASTTFFDESIVTLIVLALVMFVLLAMNFYFQPCLGGHSGINNFRTGTFASALWAYCLGIAEHCGGESHNRLVFQVYVCGLVPVIVLSVLLNHWRGQKVSMVVDNPLDDLMHMGGEGEMDYLDELESGTTGSSGTNANATVRSAKSTKGSKSTRNNERAKKAGRFIEAIRNADIRRHIFSKATAEQLVVLLRYQTPEIQRSALMALLELAGDDREKREEVIALQVGQILDHLLRSSKDPEIRLYAFRALYKIRIPEFASLQDITLSNSTAKDPDIEVLKKLPSLHSLEIVKCKISEHGLRFLGDVSGLRRLDLSTTQTTESTLNALGRLQLEDLSLASCKGIHDRSIQPLTALTSLQSLDLSGTRITDRGIQCLPRLTNLRRLFVSHTKISDTSLTTLGDMTKLCDLALSQCIAVSDTGIACLTKLTDLVALNISGCSRITDEGIGYLTTLENLEKVNLSMTGVSNTAVQGLTVLKRLRSVNLIMCSHVSPSVGNLFQTAKMAQDSGRLGSFRQRYGSSYSQLSRDDTNEFEDDAIMRTPSKKESSRSGLSFVSRHSRLFAIGEMSVDPSQRTAPQPQTPHTPFGGESDEETPDDSPLPPTPPPLVTLPPLRPLGGPTATRRPPGPTVTFSVPPGQAASCPLKPIRREDGSIKVVCVNGREGVLVEAANGRTLFVARDKLESSMMQTTCSDVT